MFIVRRSLLPPLVSFSLPSSPIRGQGSRLLHPSIPNFL
uniref:Uncharacterized protein n=1 Tax=Nelumbo nucifera TaxID=4432 RepID=A0A822ZMN2_NELNU|nr:TPA_asm: hypothetical protein HUJ06_002446 [Nelumbo nucifera]